VAAGILVANRRWGLVAVVAAGLMCLTRVYVGAHFPGDVMAGLLFGAAVSLAGYLLLRRLLERAVRMVAATPLRPLVLAGPPARLESLER